MEKGIPLEKLFGIMKESPETMEHRQMLRQNLNTQRTAVEAEINVLEGKLAMKKEYLAKIEGGIDVLDELDK